VAERTVIQADTESITWPGPGGPATRRIPEQVLTEEEEHADGMLTRFYSTSADAGSVASGAALSSKCRPPVPRRSPDRVHKCTPAPANVPVPGLPGIQDRRHKRLALAEHPARRGEGSCPIDTDETSGVLLTVGHGNLDRRGLGGLLTGAGVGMLVDVRRFPGSRHNPDARREELTRWLPDLGIGYRWEQRLGGRRRLPAGETSADLWWTVPAFRAYAAHTRTAEFAAALDDVVTQAESRRVAVMCAESLWWRCHRRLIADVVVLTRARAVRHVMPDGRLSEHRLAPGARLARTGMVLWDGA